jgi:hypothetical protein
MDCSKSRRDIENAETKFMRSIAGYTVKIKYNVKC